MLTRIMTKGEKMLISLGYKFSAKEKNTLFEDENSKSKILFLDAIEFVELENGGTSLSFAEIEAIKQIMIDYSWGGKQGSECDSEEYLLNALSVFNDKANGNPHFLNGIEAAKEIIKDYFVNKEKGDLIEELIVCKNKEEIHKGICEEIHNTWLAKNADYGSSFDKTRKLVPHAILVRLHDKLNRYTQLSLSGEQHVNDESKRDTLADLAGYAIMELTAMEEEKEVMAIGEQ